MTNYYTINDCLKPNAHAFNLLIHYTYEIVEKIMRKSKSTDCAKLLLIY